MRETPVVGPRPAGIPTSVCTHPGRCYWWGRSSARPRNGPPRTTSRLSNPCGNPNEPSPFPLSLFFSPCLSFVLPPSHRRPHSRPIKTRCDHVVHRRDHRCFFFFFFVVIVFLFFFFFFLSFSASTPFLRPIVLYPPLLAFAFIFVAVVFTPRPPPPYTRHPFGRFAFRQYPLCFILVPFVPVPILVRGHARGRRMGR